ncbi:MAG TPA: hypothetical protein VF678_16535 [bacterium]
MQNRYAGDIGDYVKFAILRALAPGHRVGIAWWLFPDEGHNDDGKHVGYLSDKKEQWESFDPYLFRALKSIVNSGQRNVAALEKSALLADACYAFDPIPRADQERQGWFSALKAKLAGCSIVFVDPDNGLQSDNKKVPLSPKSIALDELAALSGDSRTLIVYHHQTRRKGGHLKEIGYQADRLKRCGFRVDALRARPFSPRVFFLLNATSDIRERAESVARTWEGKIEWWPDPSEASMGSKTKR